MKKKIVIICIAVIAIIVLIVGSIILVNNINKHEMKLQQMKLQISHY